MAAVKTLQTWIGYNAMRYHNFSTLPHALPHIFLRFNWFWTICNGLPRITVNLLKKYLYIFFMNLTAMCINVLQIAPNHAKLRENLW